MSDEEFAEFMRKAQEFYNQSGSNSAVTSSEENPFEETAAPAVESKKDEPEEEKDDGPFFAGNEMTDAEYIAYLTRSAKNFGKKD